jgi:hypothetical protein
MHKLDVSDGILLVKCDFCGKQIKPTFSDSGYWACTPCAVKIVDTNLQNAINEVTMIKEYIKEHPELGLEI